MTPDAESRNDQPGELAFVQAAPGKLFVGWGPFESRPERDASRPAFYLNDFFLNDPAPWKHPTRWEELASTELSSRFTGVQAPPVQWISPELSHFERLFSSAHRAIAEGKFSKIVPVIFEMGVSMNGAGGLREHLLSRLAAIPESLLCYGWVSGNSGIVGATPEILFSSAGEAIETVAIAGTRPTGISAELLVNQKERKEHDYVTTDIVERLAPYGKTEVESIEVMKLPTISHLRTRIRFEPTGSSALRFDELVRILHPTAALGVWPRNDEGHTWLLDADAHAGRRTFGAPFGLERPDGAGICLVAIRNVEWNERRIRIGAGSGIVAESALEQEFEELRNKREQVKRLFGVSA